MRGPPNGGTLCGSPITTTEQELAKLEERGGKKIRPHFPCGFCYPVRILVLGWTSQGAQGCRPGLCLGTFHAQLSHRDFPAPPGGHVENYMSLPSRRGLGLVEFLGSPSASGTLRRALQAFSLHLPSNPKGWATLASFYTRTVRVPEVKHLSPEGLAAELKPSTAMLVAGTPARPLPGQTAAEWRHGALHGTRSSQHLAHACP